jgi:hypothetical protein
MSYYVMLYGVGWTQRWQVPEKALDLVKAEIDRVGGEKTTHLPVIDPGTGEPTTLVVAWQHVAAAVVLGAEAVEVPDEGDTGLYR